MAILNPQKEFDKLLKTVQEKQIGGDLDMLKLAYDFAFEAHKGQVRASGNPYIIHPLATAQKLAEMNFDLTTIIAGLLHDVPEDTEVTLSEIEKNFGPEVSRLVEGITKLGKLKYRGMERYAENLRKMFVAMSDDIRVILIKFADRLHNLKTLDALPPDKRFRIAKETLEIYAPIADRLAIGQIKGELEDLSFPYVYPEDYKWITAIIPREYKIKEKYLQEVKDKVRKKLAEEGITIDEISIQGRTKHLYSLYKKLLRPHINRDLSKIYDLIALRLIVPTVTDCYSALGVLHSIYRPMPGRIKDYIANPKPNGYQSLHTTVFTDDGEIVEFQIRTRKMHEQAEYGIAAHWSYKESGGKTANTNLKWLNELVEWQKKVKDNDQFLQTVKLDVFQNRIFVFTPHGDVIDLPEGATPVDFAYHVHSSLGDKCVGARVNDQLVSLGHQLKSGDIVEIITDKNRKTPNADWMETVKTSMAKGKIRAAINKLKK
ncbi:MAG: RelA/SpoT family protein [Patescibacteria group bacterium]|jgi:GTP pyrophosphokinase